MSLVNVAAREIQLKLVYYGIGLSGKTTNLRYLHTSVVGEQMSTMTSIATEGERTLFFDFLPVDLGKIHGFRLRFQMYTVPGQQLYAATRAAVLHGADAVVMVFDSQNEKLLDNRESVLELEANLKAEHKDVAQFPIIVQYNKRDLPNALSVPELEQSLNSRHWPSFEAVASRGVGVFETFRTLSKEAVKRL
ncbi:MAG TPA: GTPase domain-containing protein [Chloroflexota bacterium]|jgi:signal recognition particle receptor subunit beta